MSFVQPQTSSLFNNNNNTSMGFGLLGNSTSRSTYNKPGIKSAFNNPLESTDNSKVKTNIVKLNDKYVNLFNPQN